MAKKSDFTPVVPRSKTDIEFGDIAWFLAQAHDPDLTQLATAYLAEQEIYDAINTRATASARRLDANNDAITVASHTDLDDLISQRAAALNEQDALRLAVSGEKARLTTAHRTFLEACSDAAWSAGKAAYAECDRIDEGVFTVRKRLATIEGDGRLQTAPGEKESLWAQSKAAVTEKRPIFERAEPYRNTYQLCEALLKKIEESATRTAQQAAKAA